MSEQIRMTVRYEWREEDAENTQGWFWVLYGEPNETMTITSDMAIKLGVVAGDVVVLAKEEA